MSIGIKIIIAAWISFCLTFFFVFHRFDKGDTDFHSDRRRYRPYFPALLLPVGYLLIFILVLPWYGIEQTLLVLLSVIIGMFFQMSLFYLIAAALMPLLRRRISSRACAVIWIAPTVLAYTMYNPDFNGGMSRVIIPIPQKTAYYIIVVWLLVAAGILICKIVEHMRFRRHILKGAMPITDPDVMLIWKEELARARIKTARFEPVVSKSVAAPVSVGLSERTTKVVLPECGYTGEELRLIFRHEIVHICRNDSENKFFILFCAAICWFNPLVWAALRKSSEDLELSCDETVLLHADDEARYEYARLLLDNAGSGKGFTSCLSASASSMRYRLKSIVGNRKKKNGVLSVFLAFFILIVSSGYIVPAFGEQTGEEVLFGYGSKEEYSISHIREYSQSDCKEYVCSDENALIEYLSDLVLMRIAGGGKYYPDEKTMQYTVVFDTPKGELNAVISEDYVLIFTPERRKWAKMYYLPDGIDRELFESMIVPEVQKFN